MVDRQYDPTGSRDPEIDEVLGEGMKEDLGGQGILLDASGQSRADEDPEPLKIDLLTTETHVIIELSKSVRWMNLPPDLAIDLGNQLRKWGRRLVKKQYGK